MVRKRIVPIRQELNKLIRPRRLQKLAVETRTVQWQRKIDIVAFFWTMILGFAISRNRTMASLRRAYEISTGTVLVPSAFYDRFTARFTKFMKKVTAEILTIVTEHSRKLQGALEPFRQLLVTDSTVIRLHNMLEKKYPACRTNHNKAAAKLHVVMNVKGAGLQSIKLTSERWHDGPVLKVGSWIKDSLLLFDLGYFCWQLFDRIERQGGYFISRLKKNANPLIVGVNHESIHHSRTLVGKRIQDVADRFRRQIIDVEVELSFKRRKYLGKRKTAIARYRLIGVRDPIFREYFFYLTNIPQDKLSASEIAQTYAARWWVELLFKEMKQSYRLEQMPSRKQHIVESLLYASILTLIVSRRIMQVIRKKLSENNRRLSEQRFAFVISAVAIQMLIIMVQRSIHTKMMLCHVSATILKEVVDPNASRHGLIQSVETRTHCYNAQRCSKYGL